MSRVDLQDQPTAQTGHEESRYTALGKLADDLGLTEQEREVRICFTR